MKNTRRVLSLIDNSLNGTFFTSIVAATLFLFPVIASGITLNQTDNFEDGTTQGWGDGGVGGSINIASGGPAGANDNYLEVSSGTFGGGPRLISFNQSQWLGNYNAAGVGGISLDLKNFGSSTLPIRLAVRQGTGGSGTPGYSSTAAFNLPADGLWHTAFFSLAPGSLTPFNSPLPLSTLLANVPDFRLLSSSSPATIGDFISGRFGVDNIKAVPEPASMLIAGLALGVWTFRRQLLRD